MVQFPLSFNAHLLNMDRVARPWPANPGNIFRIGTDVPLFRQQSDITSSKNWKWHHDAEGDTLGFTFPTSVVLPSPLPYVSWLLVFCQNWSQCTIVGAPFAPASIFGTGRQWKGLPGGLVLQLLHAVVGDLAIAQLIWMWMCVVSQACSCLKHKCSF